MAELALRRLRQGRRANRGYPDDHRDGQTTWPQTGGLSVYLTDVLTRIQDHPTDRLEELLPWQWAPAKDLHEAA
ncbi:transposase domain-containing protein [Sinorhizobium meliloti]|uniref:transposase domain-containing protein n=1 Tax=Rhizobium meliloti TaxID=382 RepID=UPI001F469572